MEAPGRCTAEPYPNCVCDPSQPNTGHPINILTGAKRFEAEDFSTADGALSVRRTFVSQPFGAQGNQIGSPKFSFGNWLGEFDVQLLFSSASWDSGRTITVLNPDGTSQNFRPDAAGVISPVKFLRSSSFDQTSRLQYIGTWPADAGTIYNATSWDWRGAPLTVADPNSVTTTFTYDIHGRALTTTINPGASQSVYSYTYDDIGNVTRITLPKGGYLQYTYDTASRLTQVTNDKGETVALTPNLIGAPTLVVAKTAASVITEQQSQVYDELGRTIRILGAASTTPTNLAYDKVDNLTTLTDGRGKVGTDTFDPLNRIITETNPDSQQVKYAYNALDVVVDHKDGRNLQTTFVANGFGDVIREVSPDRGTRTYYYDAAGRMTQLIDGDSETTNYTYDNADRPLAQTFPDSAAEFSVMVSLGFSDIRPDQSRGHPV